MTKEEGEKILQEKGYDRAIYWHDAAGTINAEHSHPEDIAVVVLSGSLDVVIYNIKDMYKEGDFYEIKANVPHHSTIGPNGSEYLIGKKAKPEDK